MASDRPPGAAPVIPGSRPGRALLSDVVFPFPSHPVGNSVA